MNMKRETLRVNCQCLNLDRHVLVFLMLVGLVLPGLMACKSPGTPVPSPATFRLSDALPDAHAIAGWQPDGDGQTYNQETLYDLVNGQADAFFAYNFERVIVQNYANAEGAVLRVEIWQLASIEDAYGLFTRNRAGEPVAAGNEGDYDAGRRLAFWQARYYVQIRGRQALDDAILQAFADFISAALPHGGTTPSLVERLPARALVPRSPIFFRQEISIQDEVWLGGNHVLALGEETAAVLALYEVDGTPAHLLLVQYPDAGTASSASEALRAAALDDLVLAESQEQYLLAVFGALDQDTAQALLSEFE